MTTPRLRLSTKHSRRLAPISTVALLATLCLTFTPASSAATTPQAQVRAAWTQFKNALVDKSPSALCGIFSPHASRQFVAAVPGKPRPTTCTAAAVDVFKVAGGPSVARIRLLSIHVKGKTATTTDTAGPPADHWIRTGKSTWKIAYVPPGIV